MPPKLLSKKDQLTWLLCEKCKVYITSKDRDKHGEDCPLPNNNTSVKDAFCSVKYSFIQNKQLFSTNLCAVTTTTTELSGILSDELLNLGPNYLNNVVFASEQVMNLCDWIISDFVVVQSSSADIIPVVRRIWPVTDKNTSNVFVTNEGELFFYCFHCFLSVCCIQCPMILTWIN